jgi:ubiquinone/menaquinone biosynthesis C-methylase UbiE
MHAHLPFAAQSFDVVFAINVAQFWNPLSEAVAEIHRVLKPRGCVALAVQPRNKGATEEDSERTAEVLTTALSSARLASVRLERRPMKPVSTICAIGQK